ncbi:MULTISPECIES: gamma-mobile-trio integrase GmtZ [Psychrobacter]|uniref:gamma-mobile-trio integrase GmtZ n=1 Tax=Psychrobacter TaxID=497 RepID=UPI003FD323B8
MSAINESKYDGRTRDLTLRWMTEKHGQTWELWRQFAEEWMSTQDTSQHIKLDALCIFFDAYLIKDVAWASDITMFFEAKRSGLQITTDDFKFSILENTKRSDNSATIVLINHIFDFIEWILVEHFSEENDNGSAIRLYSNPFEKQQRKKHYSETVYNPLPYRYICDLRNILCPKPRGHFRDWVWAYEEKTPEGLVSSSSWFRVEQKLIDENDNDCLWRRRSIRENKKNIIIYEIWSPVVAMCLFIKLNLPLRTYQVRMLDSGEADTMRYENSKWIKNTKHLFAYKNYKKGVFRQFKNNAMETESTGLYISTNKTADQNKDEVERGYEIPWQNENVLYWLEKLRNWQEKYNPITKPTDCTELLPKHTQRKVSEAYLKAMQHSCFLMRDATATHIDDRSKPINDASIATLWYKLLAQLEHNLRVSNDTLEDGTYFKLVHDYGKGYKTSRTKTEFPLHSLRVSLITCYIMDAKLPLPVVSKLLAGHSRLLMTVYYAKLTPAVMKEKMIEADNRLEDASEKSVQTFLKNAEMSQIECKMAYHDDKSIQAALVNRNPIGWEKRHHGLCLVGGNTVKSDEVGTVAGCWNGGELIKDSSVVSRKIYGAVPHGPENCVRCRWFITDAQYLPALTAHLNFMSYKASEAANLAIELEGEIENIEEIKYEAEAKGKPFTHHNKLQELQRRCEKQLVEADEYTKDLIATLNLIYRLVEIEQGRDKDDHKNKIVAVGSKNDIRIGFIETKSEILQLSLICDDAEIYPDILDDVKKTSIIQDMTQIISRMMIRQGYMPPFLSLNKNQQLIAANAMVRQMALQVNSKDKLDGLSKVANYIELEEFMQDSKLLDDSISVLQETVKQPINYINIKSLT